MTPNTVTRVIIVLCLSCTAHAGTMVWGVGYAMTVQEPAGWATSVDVKGNDSIMLGLYQKGFRWESSPVVMYARMVLNQSSPKEAMAAYVNGLKIDCPDLEVVKVSLREKRVVCKSNASPYARQVRFNADHKMKVMWILNAGTHEELDANRAAFDRVIETATLEKRLVPWNAPKYFVP